MIEWGRLLNGELLMAIRTTARPARHRNIIFRKHQPTLNHCQGFGIELGAGAHNPFGLSGAINVSPGDDLDVFRQGEIDMCGRYAEIDVYAEANDLPFQDCTLDFVVSSHVVEHLPNPLGAFLEWNRVLRFGGTMVMIVPLPGAHPPDAGRPIVSISQVQRAYKGDYTVDDNPLGQGRRGHYYVYTLERMLRVLGWLQEDSNPYRYFNWEIVLTEAKDSKVGNGFTIIARKC